MNNTEPYIFVIDLDGTIIGNCTYQCDIYNIMELIKSTKFKILRSIFDINTHAMREQIVTINRYFILKK